MHEYRVDHPENRVSLLDSAMVLPFVRFAGVRTVPGVSNQEVETAASCTLCESAHFGLLAGRQGGFVA
jgi:hypothetical protein